MEDGVVELVDRVAHRLKVRDLRLLDTVVQSRSMAKAALRLNISQPAVSKAIAELEHVLGVRLVDRSRQGIEPTEYGRVLLDCGTAVLEDLRQGVQRIEFLADPTAGEVRIGCHPYLAVSFVSPLIDRIVRRYPRITFRLVIEEAEKLQHELIARNVDFLITRQWSQIDDERLSFEFLFDESFVVVVGAQNHWVRRRRVALPDLMDEPWVLPPPESQFGMAVTEAFRSWGLDYPRATVLTVPPEVRMSLLATGRFLTIFPASVLRFPTRRQELKILSVELPIRRFLSGIVTLAKRTIPPAASLFIENARELAKSVLASRR
jgi:DNA-binding transcriptional LysR family regulator